MRRARSRAAPSFASRAGSRSARRDRAPRPRRAASRASPWRAASRRRRAGPAPPRARPRCPRTGSRRASPAAPPPRPPRPSASGRPRRGTRGRPPKAYRGDCLLRARGSRLRARKRRPELPSVLPSTLGYSKPDRMRERTMESTETYKRPSRRIAALLGFFLPPLGMLYVARPGLAAIYLLLTLVIGTINGLVLRDPMWALVAAALLVSIVCAVQAWRFARDFREVRRPWYSHGPGLAFIIVTFIGMVTGSRAWLYEPFRLQSASMLPSIEPGDRLIVKKWGYGNYRTFGIHFAREPISSELGRGCVVL